MLLRWRVTRFSSRLIGYTVLTIVLYFVMGPPFMAVGLLTKAVELVLVILLVLEASRGRRLPG